MNIFCWYGFLKWVYFNYLNLRVIHSTFNKTPANILFLYIPNHVQPHYPVVQPLQKLLKINDLKSDNKFLLSIRNKYDSHLDRAMQQFHNLLCRNALIVPPICNWTARCGQYWRVRTHVYVGLCMTNVWLRWLNHTTLTSRTCKYCNLEEAVRRAVCMSRVVPCLPCSLFNTKSILYSLAPKVFNWAGLSSK